MRWLEQELSFFEEKRKIVNIAGHRGALSEL